MQNAAGGEVQVQTRISRSLYDRVTKHASHRYLTVASWLRMVIAAEIDRDPIVETPQKSKPRANRRRR